MLSSRQLEERARSIRENIIKMLVSAGSGHSAGPLGMADVFTALYFAVLRHDPQNPAWPERDRLLMSNGHIVPVRYATLAEAGYLPKSELLTLRKLHSRLQGHPSRLDLPGLENTSGPLGQGASQSVGVALAGKLDQASWHVYCTTSDAEAQEGQYWEAAMFAAKNRLDNLTWIMDRNNIQIDGFTEDVMPIESIRAKFEAFGWHVLEVDGHNFREVIDACNEVKAIHQKPTVIIAHTIPGKGVSFMENKFEWHGKPPTSEEAKVALHELRTLGGKIVGEHQ